MDHIISDFEIGALLIALIALGYGFAGLCFIIATAISRFVWWRTFRLRPKHGYVLILCYAPLLLLVFNSWLAFFDRSQIGGILFLYLMALPVLTFVCFIILFRKKPN